MKVVILCGGRGSRINEESQHRPKPMVEIGGWPILWHIMKIYAHHGFTEFVLPLGYKGHVIKEFFLNYNRIRNDCTVNLKSGQNPVVHGVGDVEDWTVTLADTGLETMTAERVYRLRRYLDDGPFMVTYGDGVSDVDMKSLLSTHQQEGRIATLTGVREVSRFGHVEIGEGAQVSGFKEKPQIQEWINAGFFVFEPGVFDYLEDQPVMLERIFPALAADGQLSIHRHDGFWHSMDTLRDSEELNRMWQEGSPAWAVWET